MSTNQTATLAYVLSLIGGLIVLVASIVNVVWFGAGAPGWGGFGNYMRGTMDSYHNFMGNTSSSSFFAAISVLSLICGVIMVVGAVMLRVQPNTHYLGSTHSRVFSRQLSRHGRLVHRRNLRHHRRSNRSKL